MICLGLKATGFCLDLLVLHSFLLKHLKAIYRGGEGSKTHTKHFIFTVDAFFQHGEEIRGKCQISAPTGVRIVRSICRVVT